MMFPDETRQMAKFCLEEAKQRYQDKKQVKALICLQECQEWLDQMYGSMHRPLRFSQGL